VDPDAVYDVLMEVDLGSSADKASDFERLAADLAPEEFGRATFLTTAAEHRLRQGDPDGARRLLTEAGPGQPGELLLDVRSGWLDIALHESDRPAVEALLLELRQAWRDGALTESTCHHVGEQLHLEGDHKRALRWFTMPLTYADLDEAAEDPVLEMCLTSRYFLRRELGLGVDQLDLVARDIIDEGHPDPDDGG